MKATHNTNGWMDIESAPKDGTVIQLAKNAEVYAGWFRESDGCEWYFVDDTKFALAGCCDREANDRISPNAWLTKFGGPTHWKPLSPPPKE